MIASWTLNIEGPLTAEEAERLGTAFPAELADDVQATLKIVQRGSHPPTNDIGPVQVMGQSLHIPFRIYSQVPPQGAELELSDRQRTILACVYTRHHDGYVRARYLVDLLASPAAWVPPFVLQLVGEYVVEIVALVASKINNLTSASSYPEFAAENPEFVATTRQRIISYWYEYNRYYYPRLRDYPGFRVMTALGLWQGADAKRVLKRQQ